VSSLISVLNRV